MSGSWSPIADLGAALRFYTRLPLPMADGSRTHFVGVIRMAPIAGAVAGAIATAVAIAGALSGLSASVTASLALLALVALSGALHEDGLADTADGLGGGATRERALEIMRDSRIGAFGAVAIGLSLLLRYAALEALFQRGLAPAGAALIATAAFSRAAGCLPLALLEPARAQGAGAAAAAQGASASAAVALVLGLIVGMTPLAAGLGPAQTVSALAAGLLAALAMTALARHRLGGQTGDILGATQQVAEIAVLLVLSARN